MMVCSDIQGIDIVLQVFRDSANFTKTGLRVCIDHTELNYDMFLLIIMYYIYIAYSCHMILKPGRFTLFMLVIYKYFSN